MYNFSEFIVKTIVLHNIKRKYCYTLNFSNATYICREFFLKRVSPPNAEALISRYLVAIRPNRSRPRKMSVKASISFIYSKVYKNPYITIYNYPNNYKVELIYISNNTIKQNTFKNNQCKIFLDYCFKGTIKVLDENNNVVSLTDLMELHYRDEFFLSDYNIELYGHVSNVVKRILYN